MTPFIQEQRDKLKTDRGVLFALEEILKCADVDWDTALHLCYQIVGRYVLPEGERVEEAHLPYLSMMLYHDTSQAVKDLLTMRSMTHPN